MQKIYVLLRNDKQTGPYNLEEMAQFDLKPYDLIWIEGKSAGWYYPQEIAALQPYLSFLPNKPKPVVQALAQPAFQPVPVVEEKVPFAPPPPITAPTPHVSEAYATASSARRLEEEVYAKFLKPEPPAVEVQKPVAAPKKKDNRSIAVGIAAVLIVGGVFAASWIMNGHSNEEEVTSLSPGTAEVQQEISPAVAAIDRTTSTKSPSTKQKLTRLTKATKQTVVPGKQQSIFQPSSNRSNAGPVAQTTDANAATDIPVEPPVMESKPQSIPVETSAAPEEKKKKLREKILDIFRKKPDEEKTPETTSPTENGGERTSSHREAGANLSQLVNVRFTVPNDWMMGIKGAKATLVNRSSETVTKATVDVLYYDDDNQLLQKKTISFSKVEGKGSQTVSIPDHTSATRVDYNVISAVGAGKPGA